MTSATALPNWRLPVFGLLVATFAICSAELVLAGVLPAVAADLKVDIPTAGQLITAYAIGVGVFGPILSLLTSRFSRKLVLCSIMAVFVIGNIICAIATNYWSLLGGRLVLAACHGLHFGVAMVIANQVAPPGRQASAISIVVAGVSTATVLGMPIGTAIGNAYGWRMPFWIAAGVGVGACALLAWLIPSTGKQAAQVSNWKAELGAAARPVALLCYANFAVLLVAAYLILAYIVPFLTNVSGVSLDVVPWFLLALGIAAFVGSLLGGRLGDRYGTAVPVVAFILMALALFLLLQFAHSAPAALTLICLMWFAAFCTPATFQARLQREVSDAPNFASTLMNTATQVGIAAGAAVGGLIIAWGWGYALLPLFAALCAAVGVLVSLALALYDRRQKPVAG
jgi:MFS transporter, DHA1 family, inner membrane transport protein